MLYQSTTKRHSSHQLLHQYSLLNDNVKRIQKTFVFRSFDFHLDDSLSHLLSCPRNSGLRVGFLLSLCRNQPAPASWQGVLLEGEGLAQWILPWNAVQQEDQEGSALKSISRVLKDLGEKEMQENELTLWAK